MPVIISAFSIVTEPVGFAVCEWNANSLKGALARAKALSLEYQNDPKYPNPFWVRDGKKDLCKFWKGSRYNANETI